MIHTFQKHTIPYFAMLLLIVGFSSTGWTQTVDPEQNLRALGNLSPYSAGALGFDNRYEGVKGSPYLFSAWQNGRIQFAKQDTASLPIKLNVDLVTQVIIVQLKDGSNGQVSALYTKSFTTYNSDTETYHKWLVKSEKEVEGVKSVRLKFYEVLHEGNFNFLRSISKKFVKANYEGAYAAGEPFDEFKTEEDLWLQVPGQVYEKVKLRKKDIEKALSAYAEQVEKLVKANKLNLNKESDIATLLKLLEAGN